MRTRHAIWSNIKGMSFTRFAHGATNESMCFSIDTVHTLTQSSMTIREVHKLAKTTNVRGFPVLAGVDQPFPVGFVERDEVCRAIGRETAPTACTKMQNR